MKKKKAKGFILATKQSANRCYLCGSHMGVYEHHIDPNHRETTRKVWLCEPCHNRVEVEPEYLTPRGQGLARIARRVAREDADVFIHRDGMLFWVGTRTNEVMTYQRKLLTWDEYGVMFGQKRDLGEKCFPTVLSR